MVSRDGGSKWCGPNFCTFLRISKLPFFCTYLKILDVLKHEGYIANYKILSDSKNKKETLSVDLKYNNGLPVIKEIKRVSKPGRRIYAKAGSIAKIQNGLGLAIVSTSMRNMSYNDARTKNVGREIICRVY